MVGGFHGMLLLFAKHSRSLVWRERTPYERRFGMPFNGPVIPFGAMVEYHPISAKDISRPRQIGPKVLPGIFLCYALYAEESGKETSWSQTLRNWRRWTHQNSTRKDSMQREVLTPMSGEKFMLPIADGKVRLSGGDQVLRTSTLIRDSPDRGEEQGNLQGEPDRSSSTATSRLIVVWWWS